LEYLSNYSATSESHRKLRIENRDARTGIRDLFSGAGTSASHTLHDGTATVFKSFDILFLSAHFAQVNGLFDASAVGIGVNTMKALLAGRIQQNNT